jgi:hypothetical protein
LKIIINDVPKTTGIDKKEGSLEKSLKNTKEYKIKTNPTIGNDLKKLFFLKSLFLS